MPNRRHFVPRAGDVFVCKDCRPCRGRAMVVVLRARPYCTVYECDLLHTESDRVEREVFFYPKIADYARIARVE